MDGALVRSKSSSSALVFDDKGAHLPSGGCAGIFFQLFHWNRKLAKKLIFPKKVIPSACSKLDGKIFGEEDKIPTTAAKLLLISEENNGGFPISVKKSIHHAGENEEVRHGLGSPVLVARLMGLESMPIASNNVKQRKDSHNLPGRNSDKKNSKNVNNLEECSFENRGNEYIPQKFRRTGPFERHPIAKLGTDKRLLYNSRRCQAKLTTPTNNQGKPQGKKCRPRLIGAAKKILEPDLLSKNRAKCALIYSHSIHKNMGGRDSPSPKSSPDPITKSDTLLEITDLRSKMEKAQKNHNQPRVFNSIRYEAMQKEASFVGSKRSCGQYTCLEGDIRRSLLSPTSPNSRARAKIHITRGRSRLSPPIPEMNDEQRKPVQSGLSLTSFPNHIYNRNRCSSPHIRPKIAATFKPEPESKLQDVFLSNLKKKTASEAESRMATICFSRNCREESTLRLEPLVQKRVGNIPYCLGRGAVQALDYFGNRSQTKHGNGCTPLARKMDNRCSLLCDGDRQKPVQLKGDNLGLFLDQKLKELTHHRGDGFGEAAHESCGSAILHDMNSDFNEQSVFLQKQDFCCCSDPFAGRLSHNYSGSTHSFITRAPPVSDHQQARSTICHAKKDWKESVPNFFWRKGNDLEHDFEQDFSYSRMWDGLFEEVYRAGAEVADGVVSLLIEEALLELSQIYWRLNV